MGTSRTYMWYVFKGILRLFIRLVSKMPCNSKIHGCRGKQIKVLWTCGLLAALKSVNILCHPVTQLISMHIYANLQVLLAAGVK